MPLIPWTLGVSWVRSMKLLVSLETSLERQGPNARLPWAGAHHRLQRLKDHIVMATTLSEADMYLSEEREQVQLELMGGTLDPRSEAIVPRTGLWFQPLT